MLRFLRNAFRFRSRVKATEAALTAHLVSDIEAVEAKLLSAPQVEIPLRHHFAPGVYLREAVMPAGALVIGHAHKHAGFNIVLSGSALVKIDGKVRKVTAPCIIKSAAGTRKLAYVLEEMRWVNVHATEETDLEKLETSLIEKSETFRRHELIHAMPTTTLQEKAYA